MIAVVKTYNGCHAGLQDRRLARCAVDADPGRGILRRRNPRAELEVWSGEVAEGIDDGVGCC